MIKEFVILGLKQLVTYMNLVESSLPAVFRIRGIFHCSFVHSLKFQKLRASLCGFLFFGGGGGGLQ